MAELAGGDTLDVSFTDPGAKPDLEAWCRATGNPAPAFRGPDAKGRYRATIRKR